MAKKTTTNDIINQNEYRETDEKGKPIQPVDPYVEALKQKKPYREMSLAEKMADNSAKMNFLDKYLSGPRNTQTGYATVSDVSNTGYSELYFQKNQKFDPKHLPDDIAKKNYDIVGKDNSKKMWSTFGKRIVDGIIKSSLVPLRGPWNARPEFDYENDPFYVITHGSSALVENPENIGKKFTKEYFMNQFASLGTSVGMAIDMAAEGALIGGILKLAKADDFVKAAKLKWTQNVNRREQKILARKYAKTGESSASLGIEELQRRMAVEEGAEYAGKYIGNSARYVNEWSDALGNATKAGLISLKNATINFQFNVNESFTRIKSQNPEIDDATAAKIAYDEAMDKYGWEMLASLFVNYSQQVRLTRIANTRMTNLSNEINAAANAMRIGLTDRALNPAKRTAVSNITEFLGNMLEEGGEEIMEDSFAAWGRKNQYERNKEMYDRLGIGLSKSDMYDFDKAFDSFFGGFIGGGLLGGTQMGLKYAFGGKKRKFEKEQEKQRDIIKQGFNDVIRIRGQQFLESATELNELENDYRNGADISDGQGGKVSKDSKEYENVYQNRKAQISRQFDERANALNAISMAETAIKLSLSGDDNELKGYITDNKNSQLIFLNALNMFDKMDDGKRSDAIEAVFKLSDLEKTIEEKKAQGVDYSTEQEQYAEILANSLNNIGKDMLSSVNAMKDAGILKKTDTGYEYDDELAEKTKKNVKDSIAITDLFNNSFYVAYSQANNDIGAALEYAKSQVNRLYANKMADKTINDFLSNMKPVLKQLKNAGIDNPAFAQLFDVASDKKEVTDMFSEDQRMRKRQVTVLRAFFESINDNKQFDGVIKALSDFEEIDSYADVTGTTPNMIERNLLYDKRYVSSDYYKQIYDLASSLFKNDEKLQVALKRIGAQMNKRTCAAIVYNVITSESNQKLRDSMTIKQYEHMFDLFKEGKYEELVEFVNKMQTGTEDEYNDGETWKEAAEKESEEIEKLSNEIDQLINEVQSSKENKANELESQINSLTEELNSIDIVGLTKELEDVKKSHKEESNKSDYDSRKVADLLHKIDKINGELDRYHSIQNDITAQTEALKLLKDEITSQEIESWNQESDALYSELAEMNSNIKDKVHEISLLTITLSDINVFKESSFDGGMSFLARTSILQQMNSLIAYDKMDLETVTSVLKNNIDNAEKVEKLVEEFRAIQKIRNKTKRDNAKHDFQLKMFEVVTKEKISKLNEENHNIHLERADVFEKIEKLENSHPLFFVSRYEQLYDDVVSVKNNTSLESEIDRKKEQLRGTYEYDYDTKLYTDQKILEDGTETPHYSRYKSGNNNLDFHNELEDWLGKEDSKDLAIDYGPLSAMSNAAHFFAISQKDGSNSDEKTFSMLYDATNIAAKIGKALSVAKLNKEASDLLMTADGQMAYYHKTLFRDIVATKASTHGECIEKIRKLEELRKAIERYGCFENQSKKNAYDKIFGDVDMMIDYNVNIVLSQMKAIDRRASERENKRKETDMSSHHNAERNKEILGKYFTAEEIAGAAFEDLSKTDDVIVKINKMAAEGKITADEARSIVRELKRSRALGSITSFMNRFKKDKQSEQQQPIQQQAQNEPSSQQAQSGELLEKIFYRSPRFMNAIDNGNEAAIQFNQQVGMAKNVSGIKDESEDFFKSKGIGDYDAVFIDGGKMVWVKIDGDSVKSDVVDMQPAREPVVSMSSEEITIRMYSEESITTDVFDILGIKPKQSSNPIYDIVKKISDRMHRGTAWESLDMSVFVPIVTENLKISEEKALAWLENLSSEIMTYTTIDSGKYADTFDYYSRFDDWTHEKVIIRATIVSAFEGETSIVEFIKKLKEAAGEENEIIIGQTDTYYAVKQALRETNKKLEDLERAINEGGGMSKRKKDDIKELQRQDEKNRRERLDQEISSDNASLSDSVYPSVHNGAAENGVIIPKYHTKDGVGIVPNEGFDLLEDIGEGEELFFDDNIDEIIQYNKEIKELGGLAKDIEDLQKDNDIENIKNAIIERGIIKVYAKNSKGEKVCVGYVDSITGFYGLIKNTRANFTKVQYEGKNIELFDDEQVRDRINRFNKRIGNVKKMKKDVLDGALKSIKSKSVIHSTRQAKLEPISEEQQNKPVYYVGENNQKDLEGHVIKKSKKSGNILVYSDTNDFSGDNVETPVIKGIQAYSKEFKAIAPRSNAVLHEDDFNLRKTQPEVFTHVREGLRKLVLLYLQDAAQQGGQEALNTVVDFLLNKHPDILPKKNGGWTQEDIMNFIVGDGKRNYRRDFLDFNDDFYIHKGYGTTSSNTVVLYQESNQCAVFMFSDANPENLGRRTKPTLEKGFHLGFARTSDFGDAWDANKLNVEGCFFNFYDGKNLDALKSDMERMYERCLSKKAMRALETCDIDITQSLTTFRGSSANLTLRGPLTVTEKQGKLVADFNNSDSITLSQAIARGIMLHTGGIVYQIDEKHPEVTEPVSSQTTIDLDYDITSVKQGTPNAIFGMPDSPDAVQKVSKPVDSGTLVTPPTPVQKAQAEDVSEEIPEPQNTLNDSLLNAEIYIEDFGFTEIELTDLSRAIVRDATRAYFKEHGRFDSNAINVIKAAIKRVFQENAEKIDGVVDEDLNLTRRQLLVIRYIWDAINYGHIKSIKQREDVIEYILSKYSDFVTEEQIIEILDRADNEDEIKRKIESGMISNKGKEILQKRILLSKKRAQEALFGNNENVFGGYINSEINRIFGQSAGTITVDEIIEAQEADKPVFEWGKEAHETALLDMLPNEVKIFFSTIPKVKKVDGEYKESSGNDGTITDLFGIVDYYSTQEVLDMLRKLSVQVDGDFFDFLDALDSKASAGGKYSNMARSVSNAIKSVKDMSMLQKIAYLVTNKEACNFIYIHRSKKKDGTPFISERYALSDTVAYDVMRTIEKNLIMSVDDTDKFVNSNYGKLYTKEYIASIARKISEVTIKKDIVDDFEKVADVLEYIYGYRFSENTIADNRREVRNLFDSILRLFEQTDKNDETNRHLMLFSTDGINEEEYFEQGDDDEVHEVKNHPRIVKYSNGNGVGDKLRELVKKDLKNNPESIVASLMIAGKTLQSTTHRTFAEKQKNELLDEESPLRKYCKENGYDHMFLQMRDKELDGDERKLSRGLVSISAFSNESKVSEDITTLTYGDNLNLEMMFALSCRDDYSGTKYPEEQIDVVGMHQFILKESGQDSIPTLYNFRTRYSTTLDFVDSDKKKAGWWKMKSLVIEESNQKAQTFEMSEYISYITKILFDNEFKRIYKIIGSNIDRPGECLFLTCTHFNEITIDKEGKVTLADFIRTLDGENKLEKVSALYADKEVRDRIETQAYDITKQLLNRNIEHLIGMRIPKDDVIDCSNDTETLEKMKNGELFKSGYFSIDKDGRFVSDYHNRHYIEKMRYETSKLKEMNPSDIVWGALDYAVNSLINRTVIIDVMYGGRYTYGKEELFSSKDLTSTDKSTRMRAYYAISTTISNNLYKRMAGILTGGNVPDFSLVYRTPDGEFKKEFLDKNGENPWGGENSDEFMYLVVHNAKSVSPLIKQYLSYFYDMDDNEMEETFKMCDKLHDNKTLGDEKKDILKKLKTKYPLVKGYLEIDATDGQEFCTWREAIDLMVASGKFDDEESVAKIRRLYKGLSSGTAKKEDVIWLSKSLHVVKPVYFGKKISKDNLRQDVSYIKSSVMPLLPQLTRGTEWDNVRKHMEEFEKIHRRNVHLVFDSASKVINSVPSSSIVNYNYLKSSRVSMQTLEESSFVAYRKYYSVQNETDPKMDKKIKHNDEKARRIYTALEKRLKKIHNAIEEKTIDISNFFGALKKAGIGVETRHSEYFIDSLLHTAAYAKNKKNPKAEYEKIKKIVSVNGDGEFIDKENFVSKFQQYLEDNEIKIDYGFVEKAVADMKYYETRALAVKILKDSGEKTDKDNIDSKIKELSVLPEKELYQKFRQHKVVHLTIKQSGKFIENMFKDQMNEYKKAEQMVSEIMNNLADINTETDEYTQLDHIATSGGVNLMDEQVFDVDAAILSEDGMRAVLNLSDREISKNGTVKVSGKELDRIRTKYAFIHRNRRMAKFYLTIGLIDYETYKKLENGESVVSLNNIDTSNPRFLQRVYDRIVEQLEARGVSENELKYIGFDKEKFVIPLFFNENMERIELLLQSIIKREVSKTQLNGGGFYVGTSDGFKKTGSFHVTHEGEIGDLGSLVDRYGDTVIWLDRDRRNAGKRLQATVLKADGVVEAECAISPQYTYFDRKEGKEKVINFYATDDNGDYIYLCDVKGKKINEKTKLSDVADGVFINKNMVDDSIFRIMSLRVPTSGHMSASALKIVAFLPKSMSSTILVPSDHVTQFGEDFDIDKRYCYMPNYYVDDTGKIMKVTRKLIESKKTDFGFDGYSVGEHDMIKRQLPSFFDNLEEQLQANYMTDLYISIFTCPSKKVQSLIASVIGYDELTTTKELAIKMMERKEDIDTPTTLGLIHEQIDKRVKAYIGKVGVSAYSNNVVFGGCLQKIGDGVWMRRGSSICKIRVGKYEFNGNLSDPYCNKRTDNVEEARTTKQVVGSRRQNSAVDNIKADNIPYLNENSVTLPFIIGMNNFGFDQTEEIMTNIRYNEQSGEYEEYGDTTRQRGDIASLVCLQPIVKHFTNLELDSSSKFKQRQSHLQNVIDTLKAFGLSEEEIEAMRQNRLFGNGKFYLTDDGILLVKDTNSYESSSKSHVSTWDYSSLTGEYLLKQLRFVASDYNKSNIEMQLMCLSLFTRVKKESQELASFRSLINVNSQGIGKYYLAIYDKINQLNKIGKESEHGTYRGIARIIGSFIKKDGNMPPAGYIDIEGCDYYIMPTTVEGLTLINTIKANEDVLGGVFGFTNPVIMELSMDFYDMIKDMSLTQDKKEYLFRKYRRDFAQYCFLLSDRVAKMNGHDGIFKEDDGMLFDSEIEAERLRLVAKYYDFIKSSDPTKLKGKQRPLFHSFIKIIQMSLIGTETNPVVKQIGVRLDGILQFKLKGNQQIDVNQFHNELLSMWQKPKRVFPNHTYTTRDFVRDLISYAYITDDLNGMMKIKGLIPEEIMEYLGFTEALRNIWNGLDSVNIENFKAQFVINNTNDFDIGYANENLKPGPHIAIDEMNPDVIWFRGNEDEIHDTMKECGILKEGNGYGNASVPIVFQKNKELFVLDMRSVRKIENSLKSQGINTYPFYIYKKIKPRTSGINVYDPYVDYAEFDTSSSLKLQSNITVGITNDNTRETIRTLESIVPGDPVLQLFRHVVENDKYTPMTVKLHIGNDNRVDFRSLDLCDLYLNTDGGTLKSVMASQYVDKNRAQDFSRRIIADEEMMHIILARYISTISNNGRLDRNATEMKYSFRAFDKLREYYGQIRGTDAIDSVYKAQLDNIFGFGQHASSTEATQFNEFLSNIISNNVSLMELIAQYEQTEGFINDNELNKEGGILENVWKVIKAIFEAIIGQSKISRNVAKEVLSTLNDIYNINSIESSQRQSLPAAATRMFFKFKKETVQQQSNEINKSIATIKAFTENLSRKPDLRKDIPGFDNYLEKIHDSVTVTSLSKVVRNGKEENKWGSTETKSLTVGNIFDAMLKLFFSAKDINGETEENKRERLVRSAKDIARNKDLNKIGLEIDDKQIEDLYDKVFYPIKNKFSKNMRFTHSDEMMFVSNGYYIDADGNKHHVMGKPDCIIVDGNHITIIDYKTFNTNNEQTLLDVKNDPYDRLVSYSMQIQYYRHLVSETTGVPLQNIDGAVLQIGYTSSGLDIKMGQSGLIDIDGIVKDFVTDDYDEIENTRTIKRRKFKNNKEVPDKSKYKFNELFCPVP